MLVLTDKKLMDQQPVYDVIAWTLAVFVGFVAGPYPAAIFIAMIASLTRTAFENTCYESHRKCLVKWARYFIMSLGIAMFMVSACVYAKFDPHLSVMVSALFAVFSEEFLAFGKINVNRVIEVFAKRFLQ